MLCCIVRAVTHKAARHPVFLIVRQEQGRSLVWLARETGFSYPYVRMVSAGMEKGSPRFRAACARVLGRPVGELFHDDSGAPPSAEPIEAERDDHARTVVETELYAPAGGAV